MPFLSGDLHERSPSEGDRNTSDWSKQWRTYARVCCGSQVKPVHSAPHMIGHYTGVLGLFAKVDNST